MVLRFQGEQAFRDLDPVDDNGAHDYSAAFGREGDAERTFAGTAAWTGAAERWLG